MGRKTQGILEKFLKKFMFKGNKITSKILLKRRTAAEYIFNQPG